MERKTMEELKRRYQKWFNKPPSPLVYSQINKLTKEGYTYLDISNAIWYTFFKLKTPNDLDTYGIHYVSNFIEESTLFFQSLARKKERVSQIAAERKENTVVMVKPQKQKRIRKEYDWDNVE